MSGTVRVLTWNVHGGVGLDGRRDFSRIVDQIAAVSPDIVALQEVDGRGRGDRAAPMTIIRDRLGHQGVSASTIVAADGDYGQMLLSRWPLSDVDILDLSVGRLEPRRAIAATVGTPAGALRVVATHLGLRFGERRQQVRTLCAGVSSSLPTVLMGDFNRWIRYRPAQGMLETAFAEHTSDRTYPARFPLLALDRIYCRPAGMLLESQTYRDAALFSDHLPLGATLRLPRHSRLKGTAEEPRALCLKWCQQDGAHDRQTRTHSGIY